MHFFLYLSTPIDFILIIKRFIYLFKERISILTEDQLRTIVNEMVVWHPGYVFDILESEYDTKWRTSSTRRQYITSGVPAPTAGICHQKLRGIAVAGTQKIATLK